MTIELNEKMVRHLLPVLDVGLSLTLEELFSDSCEQGQDFKRVYSTFSCHLERNIESSMPKLEGETGFPASRCHLIRFMVGTKGLASRTPVP